MKVIRLTESDVENLVRKIIKEEGEFDWVEEVPVGGTPYVKEISNFDEMMECCSKHVHWSVAYKGGEKYFLQYLSANGPFDVFFDENHIPKFVRSGDEYYAADDHNVRPDEVIIDGYGINDIPERD